MSSRFSVLRRWISFYPGTLPLNAKPALKQVMFQDKSSAGMSDRPLTNQFSWKMACLLLLDPLDVGALIVRGALPLKFLLGIAAFHTKVMWRKFSWRYSVLMASFLMLKIILSIKSSNESCEQFKGCFHIFIRSMSSPPPAELSDDGDHTHTA